MYTRGLDPNHTLILIDGVAINDGTNARGGSVDLSTLGIDAVERVEIVRGPASAVYGSDAIAGVIHIITRDGRGEDTAALDLSGGRYGYYRTAGRVAGQRGPVDASLAGAYVDEGNPQDRGDHRGGVLYGSAGVDLPADARLRGTLRLSDSRNAALPEFSGGQQYAVDDTPERRDIRDLTAGTTLELEPLDWLYTRLRGSAFVREEDRTSPGVTPGAPNGLPAEPDTTDTLQRYEAAFLARAGWQDFTFSLGGDVEWEQGKSRGDPLVFVFPLPSPDFRSTRTQGGPFAEVAYAPDWGLTALAGVRVDFYGEGETDEFWSPRVNLAYAFDSLGLELHAAYGRGFKVPAFFSLANPVAGNRNLRPERSESFEVGLRQQLPYAEASLGITHFYTQVQNLIDFDTASFQLRNLGRVESIGFEAYLDARPHPTLETRSFVTYANTEDQQGNRLRSRPTWRAGLSTTWLPFDGWSLRANLLYVDDVRDSSVPTGPATLDSYVRLDLVLAWAPRPFLEAYVAIDNLTDAAYQEAVGFRSVGIRPRAGVRVAF